MIGPPEPRAQAIHHDREVEGKRVTVQSLQCCPWSLSAPKAEYHRNGKLVLVADGDAIVCTGTKKMLEHSGSRAVTAQMGLPDLLHAKHSPDSLMWPCRWSMVRRPSPH